tara:strand:- start:3093 stop:3518 length:426 start_codon:yes stop_codon:yes gene_type:complete
MRRNSKSNESNESIDIYIRRNSKSNESIDTVDSKSSSIENEIRRSSSHERSSSFDFFFIDIDEKNNDNDLYKSIKNNSEYVPIRKPTPIKSKPIGIKSISPKTVQVKHRRRQREFNKKQIASSPNINDVIEKLFIFNNKNA